MNASDSPDERALRKLLWLTALGLAALCAAVAVAIDSREAVAAPLPVTTLRIGITPSHLPVSTGERDYTNGSFDAAYARELAQQLGVEAELVPLPRDAQWNALQQGRVDLVLARPGDNQPAPAGLRTLTTGYTSGLSVSMRSDTTVRHWKDLSGHVVCTSADNTHAQQQARQIGSALKVFDAPAQALVRVRTGECAAAILDRSQLDALLARKEWLKFSATLPPTGEQPLHAVLAEGRAELLAPVRAAVQTIGSNEQWTQRHQKWASNVAFEVYFDQTGPDCH